MDSRPWLLNIAVFFIPGLIFLTYICIVFPAVKDIVQPFWEEPKITGLVLIVVCCFIAGGLVDFLRGMVTSFVSSERLKILSSLTNRTQGYQYLNLSLNISISILVVWGLSFLKESNNAPWIWFAAYPAAGIVALFLMVLTYIIFYLRDRQAKSQLKKASQHNGKCKGDA